MAGPTRQISFRLRPEGGAEVVNEVRKVEEAGVKANTAVGAAAERATAAAERQEAQWRRNAEAMRMAASAAQAQAQFNATLGVGGSGKSAADSFAVFAANDDDAGRAAAIRAQIDPLAAAQDRYNRELAETNRLRAAGHLSDEEAIRQQNRLQRELDETTAALNRNTNGLTRRQMAGRLNVTRQLTDIGVTGAMGMNPAMIAIQQGPQLLEAMSESGLKASASMIALGGAVAVAAGAVVAMGAAWHDAAGDYLALERAATGMGRTAGLTAGQLQDLAREGAIAATISTAAAEKQAAAFVSTGRIGGEVIGQLIALSKDYAAFVGQDTAEATESLSKAMLDPVAAAKQWTREFGLLDQATIKNIETLQKHGKISEAQEILAGELSEAVAGQAAKVDELTGAWQALGRMVSNVWTDINQALYRTRDEKIAALQAGMASQHDTPTGRANRERMQFRINALRTQAAIEDMLAGSPERKAANQQAQLEADGAGRPKTDRSAERAAREALQRRRREEDRAWQIEMEVARAMGDTDHVRALEEEEAIRSRIRQLVDDEVSAEDARFTAMQEQARLNEAALAATEREVGLLFEANVLAVDRLLGMDRYVAEQERSAELQDRINKYHETELSLAEATKKATADQLAIDQARAEVMERQIASAERDHALEVARLSGRTGEANWRQREADIERRAREIEDREDLNYGEGLDQARREIDELIAAEAEGARKDWMEGFIADIRQNGIRDALAEQFESAADRLVDKLIEQLLAIDWGAMISGGVPGKGGWHGSIGGFLGMLFGPAPGKNARGTDYWSGGWTWVGEEGPELIRAPRGAQIADADRSRRMAAMGSGASGGSGATPAQFVFAPVIHAEGAGPREVDALSAKLDALAASLPRVVPQIVNDAIQRRVIQ